MTDPEKPKEIYNKEETQLKNSSIENGIVGDAIAVKDISLDTCNQRISDQRPIKISVSPFLKNNIISHELQETDICDNNSMDPLDFHRENLNNNCDIKSNNHIDEHFNKEGINVLNNNKLLTEMENNLFSDNSFQQLACNSNNVKTIKKDICCKLDFNKVKDDNDLGEKRVPTPKCLDTDSEEESSIEEYSANEDYDNTVYNTEIQDVLLQVPKSPANNADSSRRSSLKRKIEQVDDYGKTKKRRKNIQFDGVTVFYFPRSQGFNCIPSQGGSTLGMSRKHFCIKRFSLTEHAAEQKRAHKEQILQSKLQKIVLKKGSCSSSEESEDTSDISDSEMEAESFLFLQPLPIRQRRSLLRQAGIRQIEVLEKEECKGIRVSREMCGCQCKVTCYPETCQCAEAGIKCQVDRHNFPCGCTRDGCGNESGRIEFNPIRVRTHFLQTLMRIEIGKRHSEWENDDRKKNFGSWMMSGPATNYMQSLNCTSAAPTENSCSHLPDASNLCVSFDINQHNKTTLPHYQGNGGDYNSNGCYMFCGNVSPFDSVSSFSPPYCSTLSNFPSQNSFCHSCNSYSFSKLSSCNSPFSSSNFPYSNATFAAAVAVVAPGTKNHYSVPNNLPFPSSFSSMPFSKINQITARNDSLCDTSAHNMQTFNNGSSPTTKHSNFFLGNMLNEKVENKGEAGSASYSKPCSLSTMSPSSAGASKLPSIISSGITQHFSQFKSSLNYFDESGLNYCTSSNVPHEEYLSVANSCLDSSLAKPSSSRIPSFNNEQIIQLRHSFISEKEDSCQEFCQGNFSSYADASEVLADEHVNKKAIISKVEDLTVPLSSCSKESPDLVSGVSAGTSQNKESSMEANEISRVSQNDQLKTHLNALQDDTAD